MLDKSFGLLFYLKKPKNHVSRAIPIYLRITVDGVPKELSVKRSCDPSRWNSAAGRASGTKEDARSLNAYLDTYQNKVYDVKRQLVESQKLISADAIKEILLGNNERDRMLIKIFDDYNNDVKSLIGVDYSESTYEKYERTQRLVQQFIKTKYRADDIHIKRLDFAFVTQLELWFKTHRKCSHNTTMKYISILNMIVLFCVDNRWLEYDPFARFEMKQEEKDPAFLMMDEVDAIANKDFTIERIRRVRDVYIFCCYTGLAFADVQKLNKSEISVGVDGSLWIFSDRLKTDVKSRIPLLDPALKILNRYEDDPECINSNKVLPVLCNQKYNAYLKEIADICGITKKLTTHTARHTFGTTITLTNGVPLESVRKMMGHKKLSTTQRYARVLDIKISEYMNVLKDKMQIKSEKHLKAI